MVRAGIILYGLAPSSKLADRLDLVPAMTLKTVVAFVKEVQRVQQFPTAELLQPTER